VILEFPAHDPELAALGERLRAVREARGVAAEALAERLGITPDQLARAERGRARLSAGQLYAATLALHLPMRALQEPLDVARLRRF
jgi:transcriptional regulator with XRE-family HTH domain